MCSSDLKDDAAGGAIDKQAEIKFALDVQPFLDQHSLDDAAGGAGLGSDKLHAENLTGNVGGFFRRARQLDAAAFAATARMDLRFDYANVGFEAVGGFASFFLGKSDFAARSGNTVAREYRLGLVLVDFHEGSCASVQA